MIAVNLLPYHLRPVKRTLLLYILGGLLLVIVLLGIAYKWNGNRSEIKGRQALLAENRQALSDLQETVQKYNSLMEEKIRLGERLETINDIVRDQIIWSRQLWSLNRLAPDNLWYDKIRVQLKNVKERQTFVNPQTNKTEVKIITVKKSFFIVEGYVIPGEDGEARISPLMISSSDPREEFATRFQIQQHSLKDTFYDDYPVRHFSIEYLIGQFEQPEVEDPDEDEQANGGDEN